MVEMFVCLKVHDLLFQNGVFNLNDVPSPKKSWLQISVKLVKPFGYAKRLYVLQLPIPYCESLLLFTTTSHTSINIFQTVHFSPLNFTRDNKKKYELSSDTKISESLKKNLKQSDRIPLRQHIVITSSVYLDFQPLSLAGSPL